MHDASSVECTLLRILRVNDEGRLCVSIRLQNGYSTRRLTEGRPTRWQQELKREIGHIDSYAGLALNSKKYTYSSRIMVFVGKIFKLRHSNVQTTKKP